MEKDPDLVLDLHGEFKDVSVFLVDNFLKEAKIQNLLFVRIITGIGNNSKNNQAVLFPIIKIELERKKIKNEIKKMKSFRDKGYFDILI